LKITVRYFASLREAAGVKEEEIELPEGCTIELLLRQTKAMHNMLKGRDRAIIVSVNGEFVQANRRLEPQDEVAMFPPVSGG
jgi:molybdopterin converting factor subunit 1